MEARPISIREASKMMQVPEQFVRVSIAKGKIPGAYYLKEDDKTRGTYYVTDAQITTLMEGRYEWGEVNCTE